MSRDSNINQFIPLHFYEPSEKLPDDDLYKICVTCVKYDENYHTRYLWYNEEKNTWYYGSNPACDHVIAWASFSPEWVTGTYPGEWGKQ